MTEIASHQDTSHDLYQVRLQKLEKLCSEGRNPFQANWSPTHLSQQALAAYREDLCDDEQIKVRIAGRIRVFRLMGKASFIKLQDSAGLIQCYVTRDELADGEYNQYFKKLDLGDIIGVEGLCLKPRQVKSPCGSAPIGWVSKSLRPLPEKWVD